MAREAQALTLDWRIDKAKNYVLDEIKHSGLTSKNAWKSV